MAENDENNQTVSSRLYALEGNDPREQLIDRSKFSPKDIAEINEIMLALGRLRDAEQHLSEASNRYMKLGKTDMRALHFLIVSKNKSSLVTPSALSSHLNISTASTTKLLDRLEKAGHITRSPHPNDRRALAISITAETKKTAMQTVGKQQAKRFYAAANLSSKERETVTRFLNEMTEMIRVDETEWAD